MKSSMLFAVAVALMSAGSAIAQESAVYDPATGNVVLNGAGNVGGIRADGPGVPVNPANSLGGFATPGADTVSWLFFSPLNGDGFNLGNIFPTQLEQTALDANYFVGVVITGSGISDPRGIEITGGLTTVIPEPATMVLAGMSLLGLVAVKRRLA